MAFLKEKVACGMIQRFWNGLPGAVGAAILDIFVMVPDLSLLRGDRPSRHGIGLVQA
jgi:hypothetical protein